MLLRVDDPDANLFNVPDAAAVDGKRATITDNRGMAFGRATLRGVSPTAVRLEDRDDLAPADRYVIRDTAAVVGVAVRIRGVEMRPEQAAFRDRVGEAWSWRCAITGETLREVLDAAHLPGAAWRAGANTAVDGILLRADLHRLLDAGLLTIEDGVVRVSVGGYRQFDGLHVDQPASPHRRDGNG
jgi:hypothetical protein